jgi:hypothetical protein
MAVVYDGGVMLGADSRTSAVFFKKNGFLSENRGI